MPSDNTSGGMATIKGIYGFYTIREIQAHLQSLLDNFVVPSIQFATLFREFASGLFMAEGSISGSYLSSGSHWFKPTMMVSQNISDRSLAFMVCLHYALNCTGRFKISVTSAGNLHITLVTYSWDIIISTWIPYFHLVYGIKYNAFLSMKRIFILNTIHILEAAWESVHLAYSLNRVSGKFMLSLTDKLLAVNCTPGLFRSINTSFLPNLAPITLAYVLGFFAGDGHAWVRLRKNVNTLLIIPLFIITQKLSRANLDVLNQIRDLLKSLGIKCIVTSVTRSRIVDGCPTDASEARLIVEGLTNVLFQLLPLLMPLQSLFYWKTTQLSQFIELSRYVTISAHLLFPGLISLVHYLFLTKFASSNSVKVTLEDILAFIRVLIAAANKQALSGHYMISTETSKHGTLLYRVSLPAFMQCSPKRKVFNRNAYTSPQEALSAAVSYRDTAITNWLRDNNIS